MVKNLNDSILRDGWEIVLLDDICTVGTGGTPSTKFPEYYGDEVRWLKSGDIKGEHISKYPNKISTKGLENSSAKIHPKNTVMMAMSGQGKTRGTCGISTEESACSQSVAAIICGSRILPNYLQKYLHSMYDRIRNWTGDKDRTGLNLKIIRSFQVILPPLDEQYRIAAILDRASRVSESVAKASSMKPHIIRSIFLDMFGDMLTNTKNWPIVKLGNVCESQLGKAISREAKLCQSPSKYLRNANVQWRKVDITDLKEMDFKPKEKDKLKLRNGDVLATEGGDVGRCAIWSNGNTEIYFQNSLHRIRVDETILTAEYLVEYFAIMSERGGLLRETTQVTIAHLTGHKLKNLPLPLPPLQLQQKFIQKLNQIEKITSNFDLRTNEISQSIQQEMLT